MWERIIKSESHRSPEIRTTVERHAVRAITLQMRPIEEFIHDLVPSDETIMNGVPHYDFPEITTCLLEVKNDKAINKNQIMLPGGKVRGKSKNNPTDEDIYDSINAKIWEELHLNPTKIELLPLPVRKVSFKHERLFGKHKPGTLINHEHFAVATVAPFDRNIDVFNPRDNLQTVLRLSPNNLFSLLGQEEYTVQDGRVVQLLDSLCTDPKSREKSGTTIDDDPSLYKVAIYEQSVIYEAKMIRDVVDQLIQITNTHMSETLAKEIQTLYEMPDPTDVETAENVTLRARTVAGLIMYSYDATSVQNLKFTHLPKEKVDFFRGQEPPVLENAKIWEHFMQEFSHAYNQVALQQTIELTEKNGPQQAYILAQIIPKIEHIGPIEYEILSRNHMIKHILDVPLRVFKIDHTEANWHKKLLKKLELIQSWQYAKDRNLRLQYQRISQQIDHAFCNPSDPKVPRIGDPKKIGIHSENANSFKRHLRKEIAPIASDEVAFAIASNPWGSDTHDTFELIYRAFGLNQYNSQKPRIPISEQNAAWTKLLLELTDKEVLDMWTDATNISIKPIRGAFDALFNEPLNRGAIIHTSAYPRYVMSQEMQHVYENKAVVKDIRILGKKTLLLSEYPIHVVSNIRVKSLLELKRKWLERTNRREDGSVDLTDFFGYFIALDDEQFLQDLYKKNPELKNPLRKSQVESILVQWKRYAYEIIIRGMEEIICNNSYDNPTIYRDKGKITATYLEDIVPVTLHEGGSASSKATWEWMKYVMHVKYKDKILEVEQQLFPDMKSLRAKIKDDEVFHIHRLFDKPTNRYPIMWVMFAAQEGYEEMLRMHNDARFVSHKQPEWKRRLGSAIMRLYLQLNLKDESIIYQNPEVNS